MADVDTSFVQQVLDIPEQLRVLHLRHHHQADDFRAGLVVAEGRGCGKARKRQKSAG